GAGTVAHPVGRGPRSGDGLTRVITSINTWFRPAPPAQKGHAVMRRTIRALGSALLLPFIAAAAFASSHSEAPGTAKDRLADDPDLYAFVAPDRPDMVTFVGDWIPLLEPNGGPNFYSFDEDVDYYINIDNVGDAHDHVRYQFKFTNHRRNPNTFLNNTGV